MLIYAIILLYVLFVAWYDFRNKRVPNWATLPLLAAGVVAHYPANREVWIITALLVGMWQMRAIGGGDVKLWVAVLWALPLSENTLVIFFLALGASALAQGVFRWLSHLPMTGVKSPGAWRLIPFVLMMWWIAQTF